MENVNNLYVNLGGGSLTQIADVHSPLMMSYFAKSAEGTNIMIDGGFLDGLNPNWDTADGEKLYNILKENGSVVNYWFITHAHDDHFCALAWILENKSDIKIEKVMFSFPPVEWLKIESEQSYERAKGFLAILEKHNVKVDPLQKGDIIDCGGIKVEVLNDITGYENYISINDTSIVLKMHFPRRDVLFLGDLHKRGQKRLLEICPKEKLVCDIVQMAHHGQDGVGKDLYEIIQPKICLYPAGKWIWDNDNMGGEVNSGPLRTFETRGWMEELGVQVSCPMAYGDYRLF